MGEIFSDETLSGFTGKEGNTATDMAEAFRWQIGDPEPRGTYVKASVALRNYRNDLRKGRRDAQNYKHNYILIDTFDEIGPQLEEVKR